jgi:hypothetical protein
MTLSLAYIPTPTASGLRLKRLRSSVSRWAGRLPLGQASKREEAGLSVRLSAKAGPATLSQVNDKHPPPFRPPLPFPLHRDSVVCNLKSLGVGTRLTKDIRERASPSFKGMRVVQKGKGSMAGKVPRLWLSHGDEDGFRRSPAPDGR